MKSVCDAQVLRFSHTLIHKHTNPTTKDSKHLGKRRLAGLCYLHWTQRDAERGWTGGRSADRGVLWECMLEKFKGCFSYSINRKYQRGVHTEPSRESNACDALKWWRKHKLKEKPPLLFPSLLLHLHKHSNKHAEARLTFSSNIPEDLQHRHSSQWYLLSWSRTPGSMWTETLMSCDWSFYIKTQCSRWGSTIISHI